MDAKKAEIETALGVLYGGWWTCSVCGAHVGHGSAVRLERFVEAHEMVRHGIRPA